ncbi:nicotinate-nucleotide adenylyltransferase [Celerinatantimonas yamalensis]|uniref:Probable nicotinate-nucleotide adenylyltransferase n=1 Tax=Celerinatantimonas yamalensis TaxID=559956 RepID=A0ABW9G9F2_9GAMM
MLEPKLYLGGSFDPVHLGHVQSLEQLRQALRLSHAYLLPAKCSPLKQTTNVSDQHRLKMLELAIEGSPHLSIDDRELWQSGASFTYLTLRELRQQFPETPIIFALGMDSFQSLDRWSHWQAMTDLAHLAVFARPGYHPLLSKPITDWLAQHQTTHIDKLHQQLAGAVWLTELEPFDMASSSIRTDLYDAPQRAKGSLATAVYDYIVSHQLYQTSSMCKNHDGQ